MPVYQTRQRTSHTSQCSSTHTCAVFNTATAGRHGQRHKTASTASRTVYSIDTGIKTKHRLAKQRRRHTASQSARNPEHTQEEAKETYKRGRPARFDPKESCKLVVNLTCHVGHTMSVPCTNHSHKPWPCARAHTHTHTRTHTPYRLLRDGQPCACTACCSARSQHVAHTSHTTSKATQAHGPLNGASNSHHVHDPNS